MNFNEYPAVVAPRPVRLTQGYHAIVSRSHHAHDRLKINEINTMSDFKVSLFSDPPPDADQLSTRSSPRSGLPSEALEEFLSILKPSFFPPTSPILRSRRQGASSLPTYPHERSLSYKGRGLLDVIPQIDDGLEELAIVHSRQPSRNMHPFISESPTGLDGSMDLENDNPSFRWFKANVLSSPISRNHTRNPFLRHPANQSPCAVSPLSPAAIPLPLPTAEEMVDIS